MIAPRKKLWSTPPEVIEAAIHHLNLSDRDILYDIGAGDCRFIQECHNSSGACCIGVEIDVERSDAARQNIIDLGYSDSQCSVITGNALDQVTMSFCSLIHALHLLMQLLQLITTGLLICDCSLSLSRSQRIETDSTSFAENSSQNTCRYIHEPFSQQHNSD